MANIKISELNSLSKKDYDDLVPIVDISANETKKISIKELVDNNVNLIAVSSTAPLECSTGDKYYNTTTNLIYTATATDTWGGTGEEAVEGIMYIVFEDQVTYAYNGETLVSVGGGAGTYVGDVPPEDPKENDLWVDTNDEEHLAEVDDEVSTTSTNAVQNQAITNYIKNCNTYSASETNTGQTWTDGKPIYRKVLNYSGVITHGQTIPHGISNFNELAGEGLKAIMYFNSRYYALPLIGRTNDYIVGVAWVDNTNIEMILGSGNGNNFNCSINFVIEYTKTTD